MAKEPETTSTQALRLYRDLADWYPLLTPVGDNAEEATLLPAFVRCPLSAALSDPARSRQRRLPQYSPLKAALAFTLVDLEPAMLALSSQLNPECERIQGDISRDTQRMVEASLVTLTSQLQHA